MISYKYLFFLFLSFFLFACDKQGKNQNIPIEPLYIMKSTVIGRSDCYGRFAFTLINNGEIVFYEWNSEQNQWEAIPERNFNLPFSHEYIFSFGPDRKILGIVFNNNIEFFEYADNIWQKTYPVKSRGINVGERIGDFDFSIPEGGELIFSQGNELWIRKNSEITAYDYNYHVSSDYDGSVLKDYIFDPKWELYSLYKDDVTKLWFNLDAFSEYNNFIFWDILGYVGAVKNSSLDFFETYIINDSIYFKGFQLIPNSSFALPENFYTVFEAGQDSIGVVVDNKIKMV
jgi:hypothetical protein